MWDFQIRICLAKEQNQADQPIGRTECCQDSFLLYPLKLSTKLANSPIGRRRETVVSSPHPHPIEIPESMHSHGLLHF